MNAVGEILIPITFFASIVGVLYLYITTRNRERMAMIERGADPSLFQTKPKASSFFFKIGMLMVGIAVGTLVGWALSSGTDAEEYVMTASIFLFGGLALVITYFVERKINLKDSE